VRFEMPHIRFNAQLAVQDDALYIFGGTFEKKDIEITFSDMYSIDLGKLDGVRELYYIEPVNWGVTAAPDSDDEMEDDDDDGDEDSEMDENDANDDTMSVDTPPTELSAPPSIEADTATETEPETSAQQDSRPFPRPFESLRDFYARTSEEWQNIVLESKGGGGSAPASSDHSVKELRKKAFEQSEERWWDCREEIRDLEDEQEAAGIGEVISIADRGGDAGGAGRRR